MTQLRDILLQRIRATGPISLADFMAECLLHPDHGYYTTATPFGTTGDFTTAPEISQMFGEMVGLCLAQTWLDQGQQAKFCLTELGPGRGTLMSDILRATRRVPGFHQAAQICLVEASPALRDVQRDALADYDVTWKDSASELPELPLFLVANEFFDALPIRQFKRDPAGWREVLVTAQDNQLAFGLSAPAPLGLLEHRLQDTEPGDVVEVCPAAAPVITHISSQIAARGGCALAIDYGDLVSRGDTFQAVMRHEMVRPLDHCGTADLTAHVDFDALIRAACPDVATSFTTQGAFLERLGITPRAQSIAKGLSEARLKSHIAAHRRLTHPDEMGQLFKVLGLRPAKAPRLPGFET